MYSKKHFQILLLSSAILLACSKPANGPSAELADDSNLLLGNPSKASQNDSGNYILNKGHYIISFNASRNIPNWVSWHIDTEDLGSADRQDDFRGDDALPSSWYRVSSTSYSGSGFDRGHNCPSADRTSSVAANSSTFLMTNMIPQAPNHNRQTWANLEDYTRELVEAGHEVFIVMGSNGSGGVGSNGYATSIDRGRIAVPANIWKVIVVLPEGDNDLSRINSSTRVIAVYTSNTNDINSNWRLYRTSVDAIEQATGYDLLSNLASSLQTALESKIDTQ